MAIRSPARTSMPHSIVRKRLHMLYYICVTKAAPCPVLRAVRSDSLASTSLYRKAMHGLSQFASARFFQQHSCCVKDDNARPWQLATNRFAAYTAPNENHAIASLFA